MTDADDRPVILKAEDRAAPTPDLVELHIHLSDLLARADRAVGDGLDALANSRDLLDGRRLARIWFTEAASVIRQAVETRERLAQGQRRAGLLDEVYTSTGVRP